jgi:predicted nucleotidyltransferase
MLRRKAVLTLISSVAESLGNKIDKFVLVGGAAAALLIDDPISGDIRPTNDVDLIVNADTYGAYNQLIDVLRKEHEFKHDINGPICRFIVRGITVDLMPTDEKVLSFSNRWYKQALSDYIQYSLPNNLKIKVISAPVFLCTKLEAFLNRGGNDFYGSHDLEDIISIIAFRSKIIAECSLSSTVVKTYLSFSFNRLMKEQNFLDVLEDLIYQDFHL